MQLSRTSLELVLPEDIPNLYRLCCASEAGIYWRYRGTTPSPSDFAASLWVGVVSQYKVVERSTGALVGLVVLYDHCGHHAKVGVVCGDESVGSGLVIEGVAQLIRHAFRARPYIKLYFESSSILFPSSAERLLEREGILKAYVHQDGHYSDVTIYSLSRSTWDAQEDVSPYKQASTGWSLDTFLEDLSARTGRQLDADNSGPESPAALGFDSLDTLLLMETIDEVARNWAPPLPLAELLSLPLADLHHLVSAHLERVEA
jgi:hypothetical protein